VRVAGATEAAATVAVEMVERAATAASWEGRGNRAREAEARAEKVVTEVS
jgi:hypothetical protein